MERARGVLIIVLFCSGMSAILGINIALNVFALRHNVLFPMSAMWPIFVAPVSMVLVAYLLVVIDERSRKRRRIGLEEYIDRIVDQMERDDLRN